MISARDCGFSYGDRRVFSDLCLSVQAGELVALIGPNGAGKTTLIHVLSGVKRATTGSVLISEDAGPCELGLLSPEARARKLAVVEQSVVPAFDF
ncbi:MAG TPA: ATP-binding cassette domain-containing protein, partial [Pseudomonadota bacterium]|nr:ATP-binding cassette domain-containing protein [Pseudomonadota bacterium]